MKKIIFLVLSLLSLKLSAYNLKDYAKDLETMSSEEKQRFFTSADQLKCPTCTGLSVLGSDAAFSMQIRKKVAELVKENKNEKTIKEFFTKRYGLWILRAPPKEGFHLLIWLVPAGLFFFLFCLYLFYLARGRKNKDLLLTGDLERKANSFERDLSYYKKHHCKEV